MLGFLTFDTLVVWSYYDLVNRIKSPSGAFARFYMVFLSILNAAKITFSFFLLLCIALGYGVVKLKLDKKVMFGCKILAACNFVASFIYLFSTILMVVPIHWFQLMALKQLQVAVSWDYCQLFQLLLYYQHTMY